MYYISYTTTAKMIQELNLRVRNYPILGSYMAKKTHILQNGITEPIFEIWNRG